MIRLHYEMRTIMTDKKDIPLAMLEILREYTDEDHILSTPDLIDLMREMYGLELERRTIYANANLLRKYGYKIDDWHINGIGYNLSEHQFSPKEVFALCDLLQDCDQLKPGEKKKLKAKLLGTSSVFQRENHK